MNPEYKLYPVKVNVPNAMLAMMHGNCLGSLLIDLTPDRFPGTPEEMESVRHEMQKNLIEVESAMLNSMTKEEIKERRYLVLELAGLPPNEIKGILGNMLDDLIDNL